MSPPPADAHIDGYDVAVVQRHRAQLATIVSNAVQAEPATSQPAGSATSRKAERRIRALLNQGHANASERSLEARGQLSQIRQRHLDSIRPPATRSRTVRHLHARHAGDTTWIRTTCSDAIRRRSPRRTREGLLVVGPQPVHRSDRLLHDQLLLRSCVDRAPVSTPMARSTTKPSMKSEATPSGSVQLPMSPFALGRPQVRLMT